MTAATPTDLSGAGEGNDESPKGTAIRLLYHADRYIDAVGIAGEEVDDLLAAFHLSRAEMRVIRAEEIF